MKPGLRVLLAASLSLNLLIIGAAAGIAITGGSQGRENHTRAPGDMAVGPLTHALSREDRHTIKQSLRRSATADGWNKRAHFEAMQSMANLIAATPYDALAFETELARTLEGVQSRMGDASAALVEHVSAMSDEDRAAYALRVQGILNSREP